MTTNRTTAGLRDRKKAETRANIARAAVELFVYHGPEHTTIANIAEQAAISTRTFHNYFPNLEAALLHHLEEMVVNLARTVDNTPDGQTVIDETKNLAYELYFHPNEPLNSIETLRRVVEHLAHCAADTSATGCTIGSDKDPVTFMAPLVDALRNYADRNDQQLSMFHASLLLNNAIWICANISETASRSDYAEGRSDREMLDEAFALTTAGFGAAGFGAAKTEAE